MFEDTDTLIWCLLDETLYLYSHIQKLRAWLNDQRRAEKVVDINLYC